MPASTRHCGSTRRATPGTSRLRTTKITRACRCPVPETLGVQPLHAHHRRRGQCCCSPTSHVRARRSPGMVSGAVAARRCVQGRLRRCPSSGIRHGATDFFVRDRPTTTSRKKFEPVLATFSKPVTPPRGAPTGGGRGTSAASRKRGFQEWPFAGVSQSSASVSARTRNTLQPCNVRITDYTFA